MQTSELEKNKNHLHGEEECINFRPSPNFKHMKKYLKSKFEEANSSPNQSSDPSTTPNSDEQDTVKPQQATSSNMAERVQPPLPPNSPPPEHLIVPKQEVEDREYNDKSAVQAPKAETVEVPKKPSTEMCRQFARGTCTRGSSCIYIHKTILEQLPGVYTFCKNFQNSVCTLSKCKFVHATVFEKEHYYRTGYLSPRTLAHLKDTNSALAPPRPLEGSKAAPIFNNPQPGPSGSVAVHAGVPPMPGGCAAPDARPNNEQFGAPQNMAAIRGTKREWSETDLALTAHDADTNGNIPRKCKTCDVTELRLQRAKTKMEMLREESEMLANQKRSLMKKDARLNSILDMLLLNSKSQFASSTSMLNTDMTLRSDADNMQTRRLAVPRRPTETNVNVTNRRLMLELEVGSRLRSMDPTQKRMLAQILNIVHDSKESRAHGPNPR